MIVLILTSILVAAGAFILLVAAVGVLRLPDVFMRMHASTKAGALGAGLLLLSVAVVEGELGATLRVAATILFIFLTAPVAAHAIGRAAYRSGEVSLWGGTFVDELAQASGKRKEGGPDLPEDGPELPGEGQDLPAERPDLAGGRGLPGDEPTPSAPPGDS